MKSADVVVGKAYAEFYSRDQKHISNVVVFLDSTKRLYSTKRGGGYELSQSTKAGRDPSRGGRKAGYAIVRVYRYNDSGLIERCRTLALDQFLANEDHDGESPHQFRDGFQFDILMTTGGLSGETPEEAQEREHRLRKQAEDTAAAARELNERKEAKARELVAALAGHGIQASVLSSWRVAVGMGPDDASRLISILAAAQVFEGDL